MAYSWNDAEGTYEDTSDSEALIGIVDPVSGASIYDPIEDRIVADGDGQNLSSDSDRKQWVENWFRSNGYTTASKTASDQLQWTSDGAQIAVENWLASRSSSKTASVPAGYEWADMGTGSPGEEDLMFNGDYTKAHGSVGQMATRDTWFGMAIWPSGETYRQFRDFASEQEAKAAVEEWVSNIVNYGGQF